MFIFLGRNGVISLCGAAFRADGVLAGVWSTLKFQADYGFCVAGFFVDIDVSLEQDYRAGL
jgi:hypothetical protein